MAYIGNIPTKGENNSFKLLDSIKTYTETFDGSSSSVINNGADSINVNNHRFIQGQRVVYSSSGGTVITGLSDGAAYYIIKEDHNNFKLASSSGNADSGTVLPIAPAGSTTNHKLTVGFDAINTKFLASYDGGTKAQITRSAQLNISINGVVQEPQDTKTPTAGFGHDVGSVIVFSTAPDGNDSFWGNLVANNFPTFDQSDNKIDNFTGDNTTTDFSLSRTPPDNRNILVTLDGVTQHPSDASTTRAYTLAENILSFTSAPASLVSIQVRHIGFAGAGGAGGGGGGGVTSVYGRSGAVVLKPTDNPTVGNVSAGGWLSVGSTATFDNNVTIKGVLTYDDVTIVDAIGFSTFREGLRIKDSKKLLLGDLASGDCQFIHDGNDTFIQNKTGDLKIANNVAGDVGGDIIIQAMNGENSINCVHDAQVELFADSSKKFETSKDGVEITGVTTSTKRIDIDAGGLNVTAGISTFGGGVAIGATLNVVGVSTFNDDITFIGSRSGITSAIWDKSHNRLEFVDNAAVMLGTGEDLLLYTDGSNSYIDHSGDGNLRIRSLGSAEQINILAAGHINIKTAVTPSSDKSSIVCTANYGVDIYYNDVKKIETTGGGISVAGIITATSFNGAGITSTSSYPNYRPALDLNFAAVKKLDSRLTYKRTGTASYTDEKGIVRVVGANVPRFDHDPVTRECKGLLIEPSRTNIFASSDPAASAWILNNSLTREANTTETTAPDGTFTACKLMSEASANSTSQIYDGMSRSSGGVQSLWAKKGTHNVLGIFDYSGGTGIRGWFDLNTGEHRCEGGSKVAAGVQSNGNDTNTTNMVEYPNGWYRCIYYEAANMTYAHFRIVDFDSDNEASASSNSIYLWGLQAEEGGVTFATSHIPCNTGLMPGTITRGEDVVLIDGTEFTDFFNPTEGTSVVHAHMPSSSGNSGLPAYSFLNSSVSAVTLGLSRDGNASPAYHYYNDGSNSGFTRASATGDNMYKGAMSFKTSDFDSYVNGSVNTNTTTFTMPTIDNLRIGGVGGANQLGGHVARFMYYPKKLPNSQLVGLTS